MNQTESIKAYLEEKASKHKIAYTDLPKYQELIEGYLNYLESINRFCADCKFNELDDVEELCNGCFGNINKPNWQKA